MSAAACCPTCGQTLPDLAPLHQQILGLLSSETPPSRQQIADDLGCSLSTVDRVARLYLGKSKPGRPRKARGRVAAA